MNSSQRPIAIITAGAGGMFCGSCLNDNTLAASLCRQGIDAQLIPTYTPIRTDEHDVSIDRVFFGGINVFLEQKLPWWGRLPRWLTGWLDNPRLVRWATSGQIETDYSLLGPLTISMLRGSAGRQHAEVARLVDWLTGELRPQLVQLSNLLISGFVPDLKQRWDAPVLVSLQGDDIFLEGLPEDYRRQALLEMRRIDASIDGYLVHSEYYADHMATYLSIPRSKLHRVPLGINLEDFELVKAPSSADQPPSATTAAAGSGSAVPGGSTPADGPLADGPGFSAERPPVTIGYLARLAPEKGLHRLCEAFCGLKADPQTRHVRLRVAGWLGADHRDYAAAALNLVRQAGYADDLDVVGELNRGDKLRFLRSLDILSVPSPYQDPKGLYVLEALAAGVPVVQPDHGAFPELLASTGGGVLFAANDASSLQEKLTQLVLDPELRNQLSSQGRAGVRQRHTAEVMAQAVCSVYSRFL